MTDTSEWIHGGRTLPPTPLAGMDLNSGYMPVRRVFFFAGTPDIEKLQSSLAQALAQWPDFSATIAIENNQLCLLRNDRGVRFSIEHCAENIPDFGIDQPLGLPSPYCDEAIGQTTGDGGPVFTIRIRIFNNAHWTLGTCNSHALCDGSGYWQFMQSWVDAFHDNPLPVIGGDFMRHGAQTLHDAGISPASVPQDLQVPAVSLFKQQMANAQHYHSAQCLLPQATLESLKNRANAELAPDWVSTQDVVMAMSWQCLAHLALDNGAAAEDDFPLANVINIRPQLKLTHYTGNMAYSVISHASLAHLLKTPLAQLAQQLRRDAQQLRLEDIHEHLAFMQQKLQQGQYNSAGYLTGFSARIAQACVQGRGVMVNNWSKFPAYDMNFGSTPLWFDLATVIPMHFVMAMPSPEGVVLRWFLPKTQLKNAISCVQDWLDSAEH